MIKNALIIGYGSIGRRHAGILSKILGKKNISIVSKQKKIVFKTYKNLDKIKQKPDYIVVANRTSSHLRTIKNIEKKFKGLKVLVEKPLFEKNYKFNIRNNKYYVGYNMRFNPIIKFIKKKIKNKKMWRVKASCNSFLPSWRKNIKYYDSSSAKKKYGGGVSLDLSHEVDYIQYLFGKIKLNKAQKAKFSNLKIDVEDFVNILGKTKKISFLQINLDYFSKINERSLKIDGKNFSLYADFIKKKINFIKNKSEKIIYFKKYNRNYEYEQQHRSIIFNKNLNKICTYFEGIQILKLLNGISKI